MGHPYRIREIAQQAGLSEATVDRVLNRRPGVRPSTVQEVQQAIADLDRQRTQLRLAGQTFLVDLVMHTPDRFSKAVRSSLEAELPSLRPAVIRARFHLMEEAPIKELTGKLAEVKRRGSQGVLLKAPDHPDVLDAISDLVEAGIPVVTLVTDVPMSRRLAYVGIDNRSAGATAAYLLHTMGADSPGNVLVTLSSSSFRGEEEREIGFRAAMRQMAPNEVVREVTETQGLYDAMLEGVTNALEDDPAIDSVYSIGGGNLATLDAFTKLGRECRVFIGHDLDAENVSLLRDHRISAVLHHDLRQDMRRACRLIMQAHGALPGTAHSIPSQIQVITPYNQPSSFTVG
jgi:LacI family transcriptional regulator